MTFLARNVGKSYAEPMLQRELEHRGVVTSKRGFEAKLIGSVEAR